MSGGTFGGGQCAWGTPSDSDQPAGFTATLIRDQEEVQIVLYVEIWLHNPKHTLRSSHRFKHLCLVLPT